MIAVVGVRVEHRDEGLGIGVARPRVSWRTETDAAGWMQAAYEIEARREAGTVAWGTGRVE